MVAIKICGIRSLHDAQRAWACGADLLGFNFYPPSPRYIEPTQVARIARILRSQGCDALLVGLFVNESPETVRRAVSLCELDLVQLHGDEKPHYVRELGIPAIIARRVRGEVPWGELAEFDAWAHLLDTYDPGVAGGTGRSWSWDLFKHDEARNVRVLIAGGLNADNVALAIRQLQPWGVDVCSGVESSPGRKDPVLVERFIRSAKEASAP